MKKQFKRHIILAIFGLILTSVVVSCGNRRHENNNQKLKKKSDRELIKSLFSKEDIPFDFLSVRIGVDMESNIQNVSLSCSVKLNVDTAFGGTIKAGPIVIGPYKVTRDSVIFVKKRPNKCYYAENLNYLSSLFGATVEYDFFQDLILGLPIGLNEDTKYQQIDHKDHYILASHKKRDFKRLENDRFDSKDDLMLIQYHLNPTTLDLDKIEVEIPSDTTSITVNYLERKLVDGHQVPEETTIKIVNPSDSIFIQLNYGPVKLNERRAITIKIPDSYIECN